MSPVVPDALEKVQGLPQAVGVVIFPDHHVVAAAGGHVDDGGDVWVGGVGEAPWLFRAVTATHVRGELPCDRRIDPGPPN